MKILIVENEIYLAQSIATKLNHLGFDCENTSSIKEALNFQVVDIILLSTNIAGQDFYPLIERFQNSIIILMIPYINDDTVTFPLQAGASDYIVKPFMIDELIRKIEHFTLYKQLQKEVFFYKDYFCNSLINPNHSINTKVSFPLIIKSNSQKNIDAYVINYAIIKKLSINFQSLYKNSKFQDCLKNISRQQLNYIIGFETLPKEKHEEFLKKLKNTPVILSYLGEEIDSFNNVYEINTKNISHDFEEDILSVDEYIKMTILKFEDKYPDTELSKKLGMSRKSLWEKERNMELQRKNKALFIDKEAIFALLLCQEGLLYPVTHLMDKEKMLEVDKSGLYNNQSFPFSFILAPAGNRNEEIIKTATKGEVLNLVYNHQIYGTLKVDSSFFIDKKERLLKIMGGDIYSQKAQDIYHRLGNYAICGEYNITTTLANNLFKDRISKDKTLQIKKNTKAQNITSMVLHASPITRIHEYIFQLILEKSQSLILLLLRKQNEDLLDFQIRRKCLEYVIENFLPKGRIMIFPLDNIYLFAGAHGIILDAILSQNLGCDRMVIGENYPNLAIYYDHQKSPFHFDTIKNIKIKVKLLSEFVYCEECNAIVSAKTCPHGKHHHINYHSSFIQSILKSGLIPPTILVRKEISAKILSHLFPNRFQHIIKQYQTMFSKSGILQEQSEEDFYLKLIDLYQTHL